MTDQDKTRDLLERCGIPSKEIKVYGSQVMVTCWSENAARRFYSLLRLAKFSTVRGPTRARDYDKVNQRTVLRPSTHVVWRVWATA